VPTHKTGTAFTKPADPILGQALGAWQAIRPEQPKLTDRRTGDLVDLLFDPVVEVGEGDRTVPTTRHPIRFSETPATYRLPPPELDEHRTELRKWLGDGVGDDPEDENA
jgi:hypothetical protein